MATEKWSNIYEPHEGTLYVSLSTPPDDLAKSILVAFNHRPEKGIDVSFMGEAALKQTYRACLNAQAVIESQNPMIQICWQFSRRNVVSRKNPDATEVADFFSLKTIPRGH